MTAPQGKEQGKELTGGWQAGAAEYALGLMPKDEIDAFQAQLAGDADLQQDVAAWAEYFATFADPIPPSTPPPQILRRIEAQVFGTRQSKPPIWKQVAPYLIGAVAGGVIVWIVFTSGLLEPARPVLSAQLTGGGDLAFEALFEPSTGVLTVARTAGAAAEGRVLELWLLSADGAPVSLALLRSEETLVAVPPALAARLDGARLMVSGEPAGGAPGGTPSGTDRAEGLLSVK